MTRRKSSEEKAAALTAHVGYWLRYVSNHVSHAFARKLEREGVTVAEWVILRELFESDAVAPAISPPAWASPAARSPSSATGWQPNR